MLRRAAAILALLALAAPAPDAVAKPRGCFTKAEQNAELLVRAGLRLREGGIGCDAEPYNAGTKPLWEAVDKQFGAQFKQQTDVRRAAFIREFENDAQDRLSMWDSRIVFFYRHFPLSAVYCDSIKTTLMEMPTKGWPVFVKTARYATDQIRMTYQPCDQ